MAIGKQHLRLPDNFKPTHYEISLSNLDTEKDTFAGHVKIDFECRRPSEDIYLNVRDLRIDRAQVTINERTLDPKSLQFDAGLEAIIISMPEPITKTFSVSIHYRGEIQTNMSGFYRSNYMDYDTKEEKLMLSTQFEATDARRAFPCIDEPAKKATFKVSITAQEGYTVLSNMPKDKTVHQGHQTKHIFHTTPFMSTYLVAWAIGEYEYIEGKTERKIYPALDQYSVLDGSSATRSELPIRIYTATGKKNQGKFALSVATKAVDLFSELFKIPYPLPKLDLLCIESYSHNAMENFSLITFRPTALLIEDKGGQDISRSALEKVAYVVCHEIAHQWFGNLVTMNWWDELWLNEGFATWIGWYAVSILFPHWDVHSIVLLRSHETALQLDALQESHPVKVRIRDPKDIDQVFDTISYLKGCSVLEMISGYLGERDFLSGVALYLQRNKWGNASMEDLFECLCEVSKVDILTNLVSWLLEAGYPLLTVSQSKGKLHIKQQKYHSEKKSDKTTVWWIPLLLTKDDEFLQKLDFSDRSITLEAGLRFNLVNTDGAAFYRTKYETPKLMQALCNNLDKLSSRSKMCLILDVYALHPVSDFLHLSSDIMKAHSAKEVYVWKTISFCLIRIRSIMFSVSSPDLIAKLDQYILRLIDPWIDEALLYCMTEEVHKGRKKKSNCALTSQFYESILATAGQLSHPKTVKAARKLFSIGKIKASNRTIVLKTVLSQPDTSRSTFDEVVGWLDRAVLEELETMLRCLGSITNAELFKPCLELLFKIEPMNVQFLSEGWKDNPCMHPAILSFVKHYSTQIVHRLGINQAVIAKFIGFTFAYNQGKETVRQVKSIFEECDISAYDRILKQIFERMEDNTQYSSINLPSLEHFFK